MGIARKERKPKKKPFRDKAKETLDILTKLILELGFTVLYKDIFVVLFQKESKVLEVDKADGNISYYINWKLKYRGDKFTNIEELIK